MCILFNSENIMKTIKSIFKSIEVRVRNADKNRLAGSARQVYLHGLARLSKAAEVASRGNKGRGFKTKFLFSEPKQEKQVKF